MSTRTFQAAGGYTYLGLLAVIALIGAASSAAMLVVSTSQRSEQEEELLFIGRQFQSAIASYNASTPVGQPRYPNRLEDLLRDPRFPDTRRHLRKIYVDPVTRVATWGLLIAPKGGIMGVHSLSTSPVLKSGNFPPGLEHFVEANRHDEWAFVHVSPHTLRLERIPGAKQDAQRLR